MSDNALKASLEKLLLDAWISEVIEDGDFTDIFFTASIAEQMADAAFAVLAAVRCSQQEALASGSLVESQ